ncbi:DUF3540 domain-containing protein [Eleftheria terrae]|uniref:DUF3540 domain-containing protein n=1 Tax=Eleftheria terrae TaxID=1597781 RepID=UPI00263B185E|nr:DUF3540 domain-containing protein [Eleftheria terrae]WKB53777.1 DUF3540 domain-containing protein [Eleftheria terrae]
MQQQDQQERQPAPAATTGLTQGVIQHVGEVERVSAESARVLTVSTAAGLRRARLAASCLALPACGDRVLLASDDSDLYVLAVLARASQEPLVLQTEGDLRLEVQGRLDVQARDAAQLAAPQLRLEGREVEIAADKLNILSRAAHWVADTLETAARALRQVSQTHTLQAKGFHRQVDELESARVGHLDLKAREMLNVHARHAVVKSSELVKIDGKQIQVG